MNGLTGEALSKVKSFGTLTFVIGLLYTIGTTVLYLVSYNENQDSSIFYVLPIDLLIGGAITYMGNKLRTKGPQLPVDTIKFNTQVLMGLSVFIFAVAISQGSEGGFLHLVVIGFGAQVLSQLKNSKTVQTQYQQQPPVVQQQVQQSTQNPTPQQSVTQQSEQVQSQAPPQQQPPQQQ